MSTPTSVPAHFLDIKKELASAYPSHVTQAWSEVLVELAKVTETIEKTGWNTSPAPYHIDADEYPQVPYKDLESLSPEKSAEIKRNDVVVTRDIVDDNQAISWKDALTQTDSTLAIQVLLETFLHMLMMEDGS